MKSAIEKLYEISKKESKIILGLMSGTSLDGLDIACCKINGSGKNTTIELIEFCTMPYPASFQERIRELVSSQKTTLLNITLMNAQIARVHANLINTVLEKWRLDKENIDLIASHGQTIFHAPMSIHQQHETGHATLQLGDGDHIAAATRIITISDFRQKHIALGGEGAPLVCYGDYLLFSHPTKTRILLNIGGIANITYIPAGAEFGNVVATDTGPGNCLMDTWIRKHYPEKQCDQNGELAASGKIIPELLNEWMKDKFFSASFPKTTGTETFHFDFIESGIKKSNFSNVAHQDVLATLNHLTALTISDAIKKIASDKKEYEVLISGGGLYNQTLINNISKLLPEGQILDEKKWPIPPDAKEAVLFALLANETLSGEEKTFQNNNKQHPNVSMGKICLPG